MGVLSSKYYVSNKIQRKTYLTVKERYTKVKKKKKNPAVFSFLFAFVVGLHP